MSKRTGGALVGGVLLLAALAFMLPRRARDWRIEEREFAEELYVARCALCHEIEGGIGTPLDRRVIASYGTAQRLFNYVRLAMPYEAPRTLSDEAYWLTVGHLLRSRGLVQEDAVVDEKTAEEIRLDGGAS